VPWGSASHRSCASLASHLTGSAALGTAIHTIPVANGTHLQGAIASLTPTVCSLTGNVVTAHCDGTCTIRASQAGDASHLPAPDVVLSFTVAAPAQVYTYLPMLAHRCVIPMTG